MKNRYYYFVYYKYNEYYGNEQVILNKKIDSWEDIKYVGELIDSLIRKVNDNIKSNIVIVNYKLLKIEKEENKPNEKEFKNRISILKDEARLLYESIEDENINDFNDIFKNILIDYNKINNIW